jgi:hypothetical protein
MRELAYFVRCLILSSVVILVTTSLCYAQTHEFEFARTYLTNVGNLYSCEKAAQSDLNEAKSATDNLIAVMRSGKRSILELRTGNSSLRPYESSRNRAVSYCANSTIELYEALTKNFIEMVDNCKAMLNASNESGQNLELGELMSGATDVSTRHDYISKTLFQASQMLAMSLIDSIPGKEGVCNYLLITSTERRELIDKIDTMFGDAVRSKKTEETRPGWNLSIGILLRDFLNGDRKSKNQRSPDIQR